jgi:Interferon-induced transmembrane protein
MYCTKCGTNRPEGMSICPNCGAVAQTFAPPASVPNYLVQSILVTVCCCLPAGIVAIVYAAQVNSKIAAGDMAGAYQASRMAKMWSWIGFGIGAAITAVYAILIAAGVVSDFR